MPFVKGQSGNPSGRKKSSFNKVEVRKLLAPYRKDFVDALRECLEHENGQVRIRAVELGFAYLWGKPAESVQHSGPEGGSINFTIVGLPVKEPKNVAE